MNAPVHVAAIVLSLFLCIVIITGAQHNGNQESARDIVEKFTEMMERRNLDIEADQSATRPKSERMMRAQNRLSKRYKQKLEESRKRHLERNTMALISNREAMAKKMSRNDKSKGRCCRGPRNR